MISLVLGIPYDLASSLGPIVLLGQNSQRKRRVDSAAGR